VRFSIHDRSLRVPRNDVWKLDMFHTAEVMLEVTQAHWYWCRSVRHIWFSTSHSLQLQNRK